MAENYLKEWYSLHPELVEQSNREVMAHLDEFIAWVAQKDAPLVIALSKEDWKYAMESFLSERTDYETYLNKRVYKSVGKWISLCPQFTELDDLRPVCERYFFFLAGTDPELLKRVADFDASFNPISYMLRYYNRPDCIPEYSDTQN